MQVLKFGEFVVSSDVGIICWKGHQKVYKTHDDNEARNRWKNKHDGGVLHIVFAEDFHFCYSDNFHVHALGSFQNYHFLWLMYKNVHE